MIQPGEIDMADFGPAGPHPVIVVSRETLTEGATPWSLPARHVTAGPRGVLDKAALQKLIQAIGSVIWKCTIPFRPSTVSRSNCTECSSESHPTNPVDNIEMRIVAQHWEGVSEGEGCDPGVIGGDGEEDLERRLISITARSWK